MADETRWSNTDGVLRLTDEHGNEAVCGDRTPTAQEEANHRQEVAREDASTQADLDEYERLRYEDPDFETVQAEMRRLAGQVDEKDASRINNDYRTFVREYHDLRNRMVGAEIDAPRVREIENLKSALAEARAENGGRENARTTAITQRLASLYAGGGR